MTPDLFIRLLQSALWNVPLSLETPVDAETWYDVYGTARHQTVEGLLYDVICGLPSDAGLPRDLAATWLLAADRIERNYRRIAAEVERQARIWQDNGIDAVLMKGTAVAAMYPVPEHRVIGDIDWWIRGDDGWNRALELLRRNGIRAGQDSDGDVHYQSNGIVVEHHRGGMFADGPAGVLMMLNEHILHHAAVTGIGMRHLCDLAMAYRHYSGSYDVAEYVSLLGSMRMLRWTALLHAVLRQVLGAPENILPELPGAMRVRRRDCDRFLQLVMTDGNFGLDRKWRYAGLWRRFTLLVRYVPGPLVRRWTGLLGGRIRRFV